MAQRIQPLSHAPMVFNAALTVSIGLPARSLLAFNWVAAPIALGLIGGALLVLYCYGFAID